MGSDEARYQWESAGGHAPEHWEFLPFVDLLETPTSITVGVMYPGGHTPNGIPLVKVNDVKNGKIQTAPTYCVSSEVDETYRKTHLNGTELLITLVGEPGDCVIADPGMAGWNVARALAVARLADPSIRQWIRHVLLSAPAKHLIDARLNTTVQKTLNLKDIKELGIPLPPREERISISGVIAPLDDKIELNRRMNATLEGMAQALFKSWFVDFDPVIDNALAAGNPIPDELAARAEVRRQALANGTANREAAKPFPAAFQQTESMGWIPEGWEVAKLSDLLEVKYGKDHKKLSEGSIPVYGSGGLMRHVDKSLYSGESVLIPRKGTLSNILYLKEKFWTVDTMFYTIPKHEHAPKYTFHHLKSLDFTSMNVGSAVPSMTTKVLNVLPIVMPDETSLKCFDEILASYFDKAEANNKQSQSLTKLRDTLLPKLISGELRVSEAEQLASTI